jgi:hypothetical protein
MGGLISTPQEEKEEESREVVVDEFTSFNPLAYALNTGLDKHVVSGLVVGRGDDLRSCLSTGLALTTGAGRHCILPYSLANVFFRYLSRFGVAVENGNKCRFNLRSGGESVVVTIRPYFGRWYAQVCDLRQRTVCLNGAEIYRLNKLAPLFHRHMERLWAEQPANLLLVTNIIEGKNGYSCTNRQLEKELHIFAELRRWRSVAEGGR